MNTKPTPDSTADTLGTLGWYTLVAFGVCVVLYGISDAFFFGLAIFLVSFYIYFLPSFIAWSNEQKNLSSIIVLNFFLGWTLLFWVAALVWAVKKG
jgi:hypothetical protein